MDSMKRAGSKRVGHGGLKCRCCRRGPKHYAQVEANRVARRAMAAETRNLAADYDPNDPTLLMNILKEG